MPIIKSAKKKVRKDKKRSAENLVYVEALKKTLKAIKKGKNVKELVSRYYSQIDRAIKKNVIHKNKGNRLKSRIKKFSPPK